MPNKKKQQRNGFYWFMQDILPGLRREGRVFPNGMADVVVVALPRWKSLSEEEREKYERMAKERKRQTTQGPKADQNRMDNQGNIIAFRADDDLEEGKRRIRDRRVAVSRWPAPEQMEDILTYPFYFVAFEYLCEKEDKSFLPCEVALLEYTLQNGITKTYHRFIDSGRIPLGYRFSCQSHSDETHQIPIEDFEEADDNYQGMWIQMLNFVNQDQSKDEYPPLYCFCGGDSKNYKVTEFCMRWMWENACMGRANDLHRVYVLEDMVQDLYERYTNHRVSLSSLQDALATSAFDYERNTKCKFHEEKEVKHCALGAIKRYAFALSDALSSIFDFELTAAHLPTQDSSTPAYSIIPPSAIHLDPSTRAKKPTPSSSSYDSLAGSIGGKNNGTFASRDYRLNQSDSGSEHGEMPSALAGSSRSSPWGMTAPQAQSSALPRPTGDGPWARAAAASQNPTPALCSEEDFPALGGPAPSQPKFAGRAAPPAATQLPSPRSWQAPDPEPIQQRLPNTVPMAAGGTLPTVDPSEMVTPAAMAANAAAANKPTLHQAVAKSEATQPLPMWAPTAGRGVRPTGVARNINIGGGFRPGASNAGTATQEDRRPTLSEAVQRQNMDSASSSPPKSSMQGVSAPSSQPLAGLGRGRGRGVYSGGVARQASGGSGMRAPPGGPAPPPGFGRAQATLSQQMSNMSMK